MGFNIPKSDANAAIYGLRWLPVSMAAQGASVGFGVWKNFTDIQTVNQHLFPSTCPIESLSPFNQFLAKLGTLASHILCVPSEELLFRGVVQHYLLKKLPLQILATHAPGMVPWVNSTPGKAARIVLSSLIFSAAHLGRQSNDTKWVNLVRSNAFGLGVGTGIAMETTDNLFAPMALHLAWNLIAYMLYLRKC